MGAKIPLMSTLKIATKPCPHIGGVVGNKLKKKYDYESY